MDTYLSAKGILSNVNLSIPPPDEIVGGDYLLPTQSNPNENGLYSTDAGWAKRVGDVIYCLIGTGNPVYAQSGDGPYKIVDGTPPTITKGWA